MDPVAVVPLASVRWQTANQIVELLRLRPPMAGVAVEPGWPGDKFVKAEMVWIDHIAGTSEIPVMTAGRKQRDDKFTIHLLTRVAGYKSLDDTVTRLSEIMGAVEDILADDPTLADFPSIVSAELDTGDTTTGVTPEGPLGFGEQTVQIHSRLH